MRTDSDLLRTERTLWRGATTMAIAILLLMMLQTRPEHRDTTTPRFDEPGAAACVCSPLGSTAIAFDPLDDNVLYAHGNFGGAHVFRSIDNGQTWQSLDGSCPTAIPDIPVHSIVVDPDDRQRLYLGTDLGVMVSIDGGRTWMTEETGFGPARFR
jgi:hypothetical protein